jgi:ABC-2 type transport system permease protein
MANSQTLSSRLVRTLGFFRKELFSVFRQPRLLLTLVVGPFLILLIFGLGYRENPAFRTLLVVSSEEAQLAAQGEEVSDVFGGGIDLQGTTTDLDAARQRLHDGDVDILIVAPEEPLASIRAGEKSNFQIIHGEVDPVLRGNLRLLAQLAVDEINRRVLTGVVDVAQTESEEPGAGLAAARESSSRLVAALEEGDRASADREIEELRSQLAVLEADARSSDSLYSSVGAVLGVGGAIALTDLEAALADAASEDDETAVAAARDFEASLGELETRMGEAQNIDPDLLVSPFGVEVIQLHDVSPEPGIFYSPGTLVLLVQHLAVTFAALSLVRERQLGLTHVFRASPLSPGEAIAGKYLGFGVIALVVAAALTGAMFAFGINFRGSYLMYAGGLGLMILASLGLGFVLSGVSKTDSQAVQYSMMVLLLSIFFTGFVLPLEQLAGPVQLVSYLIPATYGIQGLHDIVFRGAIPDPLILVGLAVYAAVMATAAWFVMRRDVTLVR